MKKFYKLKNKGFSLTELVIVIAVIAILSAIAVPSFTGVIRKARQSAALAFADNILKTALVFHSDYGRWPNTWSEFAQNSETIDASQLESCSVYNSRCSGNQTIFLNGAYITEFYTRPDEIRISIWGRKKEDKNLHVWGCLNLYRGGIFIPGIMIYFFKDPHGQMKTQELQGIMGRD